MGIAFRRLFLGITLAVVVALLGAIPLAGASGFDRVGSYHHNPSNSSLVWFCGFILFFFTLAVLGPIANALSALVERLARTEARPTQTAAVAMIACGTLCVLSSLYLAWMSSSSGPINQVRGQMQDIMRSVNANGVSVNLSLPGGAMDEGSGSGAMILTVLVFTLGVGLISLGVWATLPASPYSPPIKTPIPAADATSL